MHENVLWYKPSRTRLEPFTSRSAGPMNFNGRDQRRRVPIGGFGLGTLGTVSISLAALRGAVTGESRGAVFGQWVQEPSEDVLEGSKKVKVSTFTRCLAC